MIDAFGLEPGASSADLWKCYEESYRKLKGASLPSTIERVFLAALGDAYEQAMADTAEARDAAKSPRLGTD